MKPEEYGKIFHFLTSLLSKAGYAEFIFAEFNFINSYLFMTNGKVGFGRSIIGQLLTMLASVIWFPKKCFNSQQWVACKLALNFSTPLKM